MTWGEMRSLLKQRDPTLPLERCSQALNAALEDIVGRQPWNALRYAPLPLMTVAQYSEGTISVENGEDVITGTGTNWPAAILDRKIHIGNESEYYIASVYAPDGAMLDRPYSGQDAAGLSYRFFDNIVPLPEEVSAVRRVTCPHMWALERTTVAYIDQADPGRIISGHPTHWAPHYKTHPSTPPSIVRIELYPAPTEARQLVAECRITQPRFDGTNTTVSPPSWINHNAILGLAEARLLGDQAAALQAERLIQGMIQVEVDSQPGGVRIPSSNRFRPSPAPGWKSNPGEWEFDHSD
jgi:hypothetical protein